MLVSIYNIIALLSVTLWLTSITCAAERIALVVGNSDYSSIQSLRNARRDAESLSDKLRDLSFDVTELFDADMRSTNRAMIQFANKAKNTELALVYFAGHGIQLYGENFLLPTDFDPNQISSKQDIGIELNSFFETLRDNGAKRLVFVIDACRDNPFDTSTEKKVTASAARVFGVSDQGAGTVRIARGLAPIDASILGAGPSPSEGETLFIFSAQPGKVALDGAGQNSPFADALVAQLSATELNVLDTFVEVSRRVVETTNGFQRPEIRASWSSRDVYLSPSAQRASLLNYNFPGLSRSDDKYIYNLEKIKNYFDPMYLSGPFNGLASLPRRAWSTEHNSGMFELRVKQSGFDPATIGIGVPKSVTYSLDVDNDGLDEEIIIGYGQLSIEFYIIKSGILHSFGRSCPKHEYTPEVRNFGEGDDGIELVELGFFDINNNRMADLWVITSYRGEPWPELCVIEFTGNYMQQSDLSYGAKQSVFDPGVVAPLISNTAGWGVKLLQDRTIEICAGSYCANRWTYRWNGSQFEKRRDGVLIDEFERETQRSNHVTDEAETVRQRTEDRFIKLHQFIVGEYLAEKAKFADEIDYYSKGMVTRQYVLQDKERHIKRWPSRIYTLAPSSIQIKNDNGNEINVTFDFEYVVSNAKKKASGTGTIALTLIRENGSFLVAGIRENVD